MAANVHQPASCHPHSEALALYEELRDRLYCFPEEHPAYVHLRAAAIAAFCHWRTLSLPHPAPGVTALRFDGGE